MRFSGLVLALALSGWAQTDSRLAALHETLLSLHTQNGVSSVNPGGGPKLTLAKRQLRDWIESRLGLLEKDGDATKASVRINNALEKVSVAPSKNSQNLLGSLGEVDVKWEAGILVVITRIGIVCEHDESVYAYKRVDGNWQRIWESEQNDYEHYTPQHIDAVHISQADVAGTQPGSAYILTLGSERGCASSWRPVYYRIWRVDSTGPKSLVDHAGDAFLRGNSSIAGSIVNSLPSGAVDAIIEFTQRSVDVSVHNREAVRHFLIEGDRVRRVAPVALSPRDFVDEWMTQPWNESQAWSLSPDLSAWHQRLHAGDVFGDFVGNSQRCQTPDLWQIRFRSSNARTNVCFLIRWTPPYRFAMADISDNPWPLCTQPDPDADAWRTLFSTQDWRQ